MSRLLRDEELKALIEAPDPLMEGLLSTNHTEPNAAIQPTSVDLTVGNIFLPNTKPHEPGGVNAPLDTHTLVPGETAIVETRQKLHLPADIAGISFPPARVSACGILTTNPGHIDPGYRGTLSFTVINMGRREFDLDASKDIVTVLFFKLNGDCAADYRARKGDKVNTGIKVETLAALSRDFVNVTERARDEATAVAREETLSAKKWGIIGTVVVGLLALMSTWSVNFGEVVTLRNRVETLEQRLEQELDVGDRLEALDARIKQLEK